MEKFNYIKKRLNTMSSTRGTWEDHWQEILDYVMPRKADVTFTRTKGEKRTELLFDSTAMTSTTLLAATMQGTLTSPSLQWFTIRIREDEINLDRDVQLWLEDAAKRMYNLFNQTNFNTEVHELYLDLVAMGTGCLFIEEGNKGFNVDQIHFKAMHISEYYVQENVSGYIDTLYRKYKLSARQAVQEFGEDNVGEKVLEAAKDKPDKEFNFIHAVEPLEDYERTLGKAATKLPFHSCHVCEEDKMVVRAGGYNEFPYLVPRWSKATGEIFGTAIRQAYYSDQLQLQEGPQMTATEVQVRYELMQRLLGPTLGRFQSEFLNPLIERVFGIMNRAEAFLPTPEVLEGQLIDIDYVGPLARSQRMEEAVAVERLYQLAMQIGQADPGIMDIINHDEAIRARAELLGVPKSILRGREEVDEIREQRAMQQQQQQEMMMQQQQAEIAAKQGSAVKDMSGAEAQDVMQQVGQAVDEEGAAIDAEVVNEG
mgnify:CR=1 FL=1